MIYKLHKFIKLWTVKHYIVYSRIVSASVNCVCQWYIQLLANNVLSNILFLCYRADYALFYTLCYSVKSIFHTLKFCNQSMHSPCVARSHDIKHNTFVHVILCKFRVPRPFPQLPHQLIFSTSSISCCGLNVRTIFILWNTTPVRLKYVRTFEK